MRIQLVVVIIILLVLSGCSDNTSTSASKNAETTTSQSSQQKIIKITSHNKEKIAYIKEGSLYIYTVSTKEEKPLNIDKTDIDTINIHEWSPDDKYLFLNMAVHASDGIIIIDSQTEKIIISTLDYTWLEPNKIVYIGFNVDPGNLIMMNLDTNQKTILKQKTKTEEYLLIRIIENNKIIFRIRIPESDKVSYWIIDKDGTNQKEVEVEFVNPNSDDLSMKSFKYK